MIALVALSALASCGAGSTTAAVGNTGGGSGGSSSGASASQTVEYRETEYTLAPDKLTLKPGTYTIKVQNVGQFPHDVHIAASADGTEVGGSTVATAGQTVSFTVTLKPGQYTVWCAVDAHRSLGMQGTLTVQ
ncbi:MAG TPA: plastocyanin/azurin family copper-binding protein [Candidatus Eisenbacteria bacterium]|nr:plastocyanin/azurin family copper-binding protein [Candidatus Eisenbacteria bacterium]